MWSAPNTQTSLGFSFSRTSRFWKIASALPRNHCGPTFIDAGTVGNGSTPSFDEIKFGAGIGVRYHTGFGPLRVDVGVPLNPGPNDPKVGVYVGLGQSF